MRKSKMIVTTVTALFIAVSSSFTARADVTTSENRVYAANEVVEDETVKSETVKNGAVEDETVKDAALKDVSSSGTGQPEETINVEAPPSVGEQVASYAAQFLGNPYVYGGTSLTSGADCSGFVLKVYEYFGVSLPRTSRAQGRTGIDVGGIENALPGDIVSYRGHIGIYQGQNKLIHASNPKNGIKISPVTYKPILSVRRVV